MPSTRTLALTLVLAVTTVVGVSAAASARRDADRAARRADVLRQWIDADQAFIDGDRELAMIIYSGLAEATGDSSLLRQRFAFDSSERTEGDTPASAARDYARLAARLERTEALLNALRDKESDADPGVDDAVTDLERTVDRQLAEIDRLRREIAGRRTGRLLKFTAEKGGNVAYVGEIEDGRARGIGYGVWHTGSTYEGEWEDNRRHGRGVFRWKDGETYEGEFQRDKRTGRGTYVFKSGERWEGEWLDDMRHGEGVLFDTKGKVRVHGRWEKDKLVETFRDGALTRD